MPFEKPVYDDPFRPKLLGSPSYHTTEEQAYNIKEVLDYSCSDSRFAQKAYAAIMNILVDHYTEYHMPEPPAEGMETRHAPARPPEEEQNKSRERHEKERREDEQLQDDILRMKLGA